MKKKLFFLFCILCADSIGFTVTYAHDMINQLDEQMQGNEAPVLDLDDIDDIESDDEDLLAILDESMEQPSIVWTWFCTIGSSLAAHYIHAQRYLSRLVERMRVWLKRRGNQHQEEVTSRISTV